MKLSIVVPCYNVAQYLDRGLRSLSNQLIDGMEIICVEDKSSDNTLELLRDWTLKDTRIKLLENPENIGAGPSRNRGIDAATGDYVGFMDPDDYVDDTFFEKLLAAAERDRAELAIAQLDIKGPRDDVSFDSDRYIKQIEQSHYHWITHYAAIYNRDFLNRNNIRYPALRVNEDNVFETMVKLSITRAPTIVRGVKYHYVRRDESLNSEVWSEQKVMDSLAATKMIMDMCNCLGVSGMPYTLTATRYFLYNRSATFNKNSGLGVQMKVCETLCEYFRELADKEFIRHKDARFYNALASGDAGQVREALLRNKIEIMRIKLFGVFCFFKIFENKIKSETEYRLFGILLFKKTTQVKTPY